MSKEFDSESALAKLNESLNDEDSTRFPAVLGEVAREYGMSAIAQDTELGRESLYKSLSEGGNPSFSTVLKVVKALGFRFSISKKQDV
ncbi:addiction module antidote protein [Alloscardovia omnicolens]|uniref:Putative addiction module antidote protein n=1 Tax=Alloscardovia omnicolens TaxID=419015 RepID=A0A2I1M489_9BIFI|nr:addiction module antidote protein [Alloscardovia omnicolens]MDU6532402.1 putative addiction module antidote protein [Alloscardovia omnicolens]MDU6640728.1 putative addiction module antidote protein [Alloscardovia omnicolens]PKZ14928.1 putative addiction module antidote protein [Alloscardovia omnicolens]